MENNLYEFLGEYFMEGLCKIGFDIVDVLDAHAQPNHLWRNAHLALFLRRQLPVCGRRRMTRHWVHTQNEFAMSLQAG